MNPQTTHLKDNLVLFEYVTDLLGGDYDRLVGTLSGADEGRGPDGQSRFFGAFVQRESRLKLPLTDLQRYDLNVLRHEATLARRRAGFQLKYFQYLAALFTEVYLDRLTTDAAGLLVQLNDYRHRNFPDRGIPPYGARDLRKLAFWMATGAGKTLVLHLNLLQFLDYRPFEPRNILLLTPTETLAKQHLAELKASGLAASRATEARGLGREVQVLEITKLFVEGAGSRARRGGVSLPTAQFEGPNLVLVDEGHKGGATQTDMKTERAWRDIREALAEGDSLTLEYSATFAQVTEGNAELLEEYARAILFEYAYKRFYTDGYGKDFQVVNLRTPDLYGETLLLAGLLTLYEQRLVYDEQRVELAPYQIEAPLGVFVGAQVTAGDEVLNVVDFLDHVLREPAWAIETIGKLLTGQSGLASDAFAGAFTYLKERGLSPDAVYADLTRRLFRGRGRLTLQLLSQAEGEIALRAADSAHDDPCGVINVGDARGFLNKVREKTSIPIDEDNKITPSLFETINRPDSPVNFLIGAKRFMEGWSSWRVSVMGLYGVGRGAGAQVMQLFGRGVRLKGRDFSLRRSTHFRGDHPEFIALLETLYVFGLKANYLERFVEFLGREDFDQTVTRHLPLQVDAAWIRDTELQAVRTPIGFDFKQQVLAFDPRELTPIKLDLKLAETETASLNRYQEPVVQRAKQEAQFQGLDLTRLDLEGLFQYALTFKRAKDWTNLYLTRGALRRFLSDQDKCQLAAPEAVLQPTHPDRQRILDRAAETLVEKSLETFYYQKQRRAEATQLEAVPLTAAHSNFPRQNDTYAYAVQLPLKFIREVEGILQDARQRLKEEQDEPLPRLHLPFHLYNPLLLESEIVKSTPTGLVDSERRFALDLREFWQRVHDHPDWQGYGVYLLRNLPKHGIGFFETAGFYPDFLLWLKRGRSQALAFIDPKGLIRWDEEKVSLLQDMTTDLKPRVEFPVMGYIVTPTEKSELSIPDVLPSQREGYLRKRNVLLQDKQQVYIREILESLRKSLSG